MKLNIKGKKYVFVLEFFDADGLYREKDFEGSKEAIAFAQTNNCKMVGHKTRYDKIEN